MTIFNALKPANADTRRYALLLLQEKDVTPAVKAQWTALAEAPETTQRELGNVLTVLKMARRLSQEERAIRAQSEEVLAGIVFEDEAAAAMPVEGDGDLDELHPVVRALMVEAARRMEEERRMEETLKARDEREAAFRADQVERQTA